MLSPEGTAQVPREFGGKTAGCNPAHRSSPRSMLVTIADEDPVACLQRLESDRANQPFTRVDPEACQGSDDLFGAGLHSEAGQGVLDRLRLADALPCQPEGDYLQRAGLPSFWFRTQPPPSDQALTSLA
jgi:hypothetical protein